MRIIILGNGIAGITAARFIRKWSDHSITVISGETDYFFSRTALMYVYMGHLRFQDTQPYEARFWKKNRIELVQAWVDAIDVNARKLQLRDGRSLTYDKLIIATGSLTNKFGWPGQELGRVQGLYHRQDLESMEAATPHVKNVVVVGGGLIGIEMAEMFHSRHIPVTMLVREKSYWNGVLPAEESDMINRHIREHGIDLRLSTELREIAADGTGNAGAVVTNTGEQIVCQFVGITAGVRPNVDMLRDSGIEIGRGVLVNDHLQTNQPDVYAIGDCAELRTPKTGRRAIEAVWYVGRMMGETVAQNICRTPVEYDPGIWFNSAKFFDIEYQVYGDVPTEYEHTGKTSWYRESGCGRKSVRIVYDQATERVLGFNLMGTRFRQEVCYHWISSGASLETVLRDLQQATFDPEFQPSL
ncbi:MAG: NAD(P)/FAD-dependent oxidoreductase [Saprospiraceae bacterium]|nr:NAD(P)/FAD-dependent oxidoreductase [Saprospiraceae bacterium]